MAVMSAAFSVSHQWCYVKETHENNKELRVTLYCQSELIFRLDFKSKAARF